MVVISSAVLAAHPSRADEPARYEADAPRMGTTFRVVLYAADADMAKQATAAAFARVKALEAVMSDYTPTSETMKLCAANDADPGKPIPVSADLAAVLALSLDMSAKTGGAFDVTIGPLSRLWRETRKTKALPTPEVLAAARAQVGYRMVTLDGKTVRLKQPGMRLDFGGIGKGFAADAALAELRAHGVTRALVAASGDITVGDPPPGRAAWTVDIAPLAPDRPARRVSLANASVSTSGDLFQFVEVGGIRYSHVLDPATGLGQTGRRGATVIAPRGALADALTKALLLMPPDKAMALIERTDGAAAYLVTKESEDAAERATESKRFGGYVAK